jgi:hypothetical protein
VSEYHETELSETLRLWLPPGAEKARDHTAEERAAQDDLDRQLDAAPRQEFCWSHPITKCSRTPTRWVNEIQFDFKEDKAGHNFAQITSAGLNGPTPGFCNQCLTYAPLLAELFYKNHEAYAWGMRPRRWHVRWENGDVTSGLVGEIDPTPPTVEIVTERIHKE